MGTEFIVCLFPVSQNLVQGKKCQDEKRQVIHKHDLPVRLKETVCAQIEKSAYKAGKIRKPLSVKPIIKKSTAQQDFQYGISLDEIGHRNSWKKVGNKHIRAHKAVIGQGEKVSSPSKPGEIRKKLSGCIKIFSHIICEGYMLGIPVGFGTEPGAGRNQLPDQNTSCSQKKQ